MTNFKLARKFPDFPSSNVHWYFSFYHQMPIDSFNFIASPHKPFCPFCSVLITIGTLILSFITDGMAAILLDYTTCCNKQYHSRYIHNDLMNTGVYKRICIWLDIVFVSHLFCNYAHRFLVVEYAFVCRYSNFDSTHMVVI